MYKKAITRKPNKEFAKGITTSELGKPDFNLMLEQHKAYIEILKSLGIKVIEKHKLDPLRNLQGSHVSS